MGGLLELLLVILVIVLILAVLRYALPLDERLLAIIGLVLIIAALVWFLRGGRVFAEESGGPASGLACLHHGEQVASDAPD